MGARVVVSSRTPKNCEPVAEAIRKRGGEAVVIPSDISRKDSVEALVAQTREELGRIDILVCNAAVNVEHGPMTQATDNDFDTVMNANVKTNLWLADLVIPTMAERSGGAVIIISSIAGLRGQHL